MVWFGAFNKKNSDLVFSDKYNLKMVVKVFTTLLFFRYFIFKMADIIVFYFRLIEFENGR